MPRIEDLIGKKPKQTKVTDDAIEMGGAFSCQTCNEIVSEAVFDRNEGFVTWKCSSEHESKVNLF